MVVPRRHSVPGETYFAVNRFCDDPGQLGDLLGGGRQNGGTKGGRKNPTGNR